MPPYVRPCRQAGFLLVLLVTGLTVDFAKGQLSTSTPFSTSTGTSSTITTGSTTTGSTSSSVSTTSGTTGSTTTGPSTTTGTTGSTTTGTTTTRPSTTSGPTTSGPSTTTGTTGSTTTGTTTTRPSTTSGPSTTTGTTGSTTTGTTTTRQSTTSGSTTPGPSTTTGTTGSTTTGTTTTRPSTTSGPSTTTGTTGSTTTGPSTTTGSTTSGPSTTTGTTSSTTTGTTGSTTTGPSTTTGTTGSTITTARPSTTRTTAAAGVGASSGTGICPAITAPDASTGATLKYWVGATETTPYKAGTIADYVCPCPQVWTSASGGNGRRVTSATCSAAGTWTTTFAAGQTCGISSGLTTGSGRNLTVLTPAAGDPNWLNILEASDDCYDRARGAAVAIGLSPADAMTIDSLLAWSAHQCSAIDSVVYASSTMSGARVPRDLSSGCKEIYRDSADGTLKTRDRACTFNSTEKVAVVCESGLSQNCADSVPSPGFYMKETSRNIAVAGSPAYGDTITFSCDKCIQTFKNFPTENSLETQCYGPLGWFPYRSLISDCRLPCNGTIPEITSANTPTCSGDPAITGVTMTIACPANQKFAGSDESSFDLKCQNVTVNGTSQGVQLVATKNGTTFRSCQELCPLDPPSIPNAFNDWKGAKTANTKVLYTCNDTFAFAKGGKAYLKAVSSTCLGSSKTWTIPEQDCVPACTADPPTVNLTTNDFAGERFINSTVTYTCKPGYTFNDSDPLDIGRYIICKDNRAWEAFDPSVKCVPQKPVRDNSSETKGDCMTVYWKNSVALIRDDQLAFVISGAEDRQKVCRGRADPYNPDVKGLILPGFQYPYTDQGTGEDIKYCAVSHPHENATFAYHEDPDFLYITDDYDTVFEWIPVDFNYEKTKLPKCAVPVTGKASPQSIYIGRKMLCNDQYLQCTNMVGGVTLEQGFRPAQMHTSNAESDVIDDDFEILIARRKKMENPFRQVWSVALPAAAALGITFLLCIFIMHEKSPCCRSSPQAKKLG